MCTIKKIVALIIVVCIIIAIFPTVNSETYAASEKVGEELLELFGISYDELLSGAFEENGETYSCIIWLKDVDVTEAVEAGIDAAEMTRDNYTTRALYDYPYTTYEAGGLTYVEVELDEDESDEYVQAYIESEREAATELYSDNNNKFVAENFMARDMSVTYVSQYSPCVFADLTITKIVELSLNTQVLYIELWGQEECELDSVDVDIPISQIPNRLETIRVDEVVEDFSLTGNGVKIGQIEPACPTEPTVVVNPNYDNTLIDGNVSYHANNVYTIMKSVAPNATYYATGTRIDNYTKKDGSFQEQVEWLLDQGVNVINMSAGVSSAGYVDTYTAQARWIDHIAYNHDVHFVKSAGNSMENDTESLRGISSPGMAYNIITVGNSFHVSTNSDGTYDRYPSSSYNDDGVSRTEYRTFKPDIVAPGTYDLITGDYKTGTSYSAPLVTGTIALLCEYKPALKTKQHVMKAILAASTSKDKGRYVTVDEKFVEYGAGMLDARAALNVIRYGKYTVTTETLSSTVTSKTYSMVVTDSDTSMRIALAYANRIKFSTDDHSIEDTPCEGEVIAELYLSIYTPDGQRINLPYSPSGTTGANLKIVQFDPREYGTGTYTIKVGVSIPTEDGRTINYGVAWR